MADPRNHARLTPEALVYREKLFLRERRDLPDDLIALPTFGLEWPVNNRTEGGEKALIKGAVYLIGSILGDLPRAQAERFEFVSLVEVNSTAKKINIDFACPYPDIVDRAKDRWANRAKLSHEAFELAEELEVENRFMLPIGVRMPLVFDYQHRAKHLLVVNKNQVSSPDQFLDPETCRTTSGFLNFLGTLCMLDKMHDDTQYIKAITARANTLMNRDLDEWLRWLYQFMDRGTVVNYSHILVSSSSPETYFYDCSTTLVNRDSWATSWVHTLLRGFM
jgi:hypothetical protein